MKILEKIAKITNDTASFSLLIKYHDHTQPLYSYLAMPG